MPEQFEGLVEVTNANAATTISLDGESGDVIVGGGGRQGSLVIRDGNTVERFRLEGGELIVNDAGGTEMIRLSEPGSNIHLRDNAHNERIRINSQAGDVIIFNNLGVEVIRLAGFTGDATVGGGGQDGDVTLRNAANQSKVKLKSNPASIEILGSEASASIKLDGSNGDLTIGGGGQVGNAVLRDSSNTMRLSLEGGKGVVTFCKPNGSPTGSIDGDKADFTLGGAGEDGDLVLKGGIEDARIRLDAGGGAQGVERIYLDGASGSITAGGSVVPGSLSLRTEQGKTRVSLSAAGASAALGGNGAGGSVVLHPSTQSGADATKAAIALHASTPELVIRAAGKNRFRVDGAGGNVWVGGNGASGELVLFGSAATGTDATAQATVHIDGGSARLRLTDGAGKNRAVIDGATGNMVLGGNGRDGNLFIFPADATNTNAVGEESIRLRGDVGDILLRNADCAEEFDVAGEAIAPGTVVALDDGGRVAPSSRAYDRRVAGVISGAGAHKPGIVLDRRRTSAAHRSAVALMGKVYCDVDASNGPIEIGSLLTTSRQPGRAMLAADPARAFGAVLGKALAAHDKGLGTIPILVALQ